MRIIKIILNCFYVIIIMNLQTYLDNEKYRKDKNIIQ